MAGQNCQSESPTIKEAKYFSKAVEFKEALKTSFSKEINVKIKEGEVEETPFSYNIKKDEEAIGKSKSEIENDKDIQSFLKKFNAKIKDNTIKPIK